MSLLKNTTDNLEKKMMTKDNLTALLPVTENELQTIGLIALDRMLEMRRNDEHNPEEMELLSEICRKTGVIAENFRKRRKG